MLHAAKLIGAELELNPRFCDLKSVVTLPHISKIHHVQLGRLFTMLGAHALLEKLHRGGPTVTLTICCIIIKKKFYVYIKLYVL